MKNSIPSVNHVEPKLRVLHVIGGTGCGGTESWVTKFLQHTPDLFQSDVLVHTNDQGHYHQAISQAGARILVCEHPKNVLSYTRRLQKLINDSGPYHVVHGHVALFSGIVLRAAAKARVPVRIAHSHCAPPPTSRMKLRGIRRAYVATMQKLIAKHATHRVAVSESAVATLDSATTSGAPWQIVPCGVDLTAFARATCGSMRARLGIAESTFVMGHVGRFVSVKNHSFLFDTVAVAVRSGMDCCLLVVGDGELRTQLVEYATQLGIRDHVRFLGVRADVPELLRAMDAFVFPSHHEGLGMSVVEAQAANLPCIVSTGVPTEAIVAPQLVTRLRLDEGPQAWAEVIQRLKATPARFAEASGPLKLVENSAFGLQNNLKHLKRIYQQAYQLGS